ncbi:Amidohydrolase [Pleurostoma richardsiae]|uniref:Amidohydrolase n=1 Tax=Pleurostoma richardsiae TaxID=41990 RepID=A0AA38RE82_9PEZI|nr:Amidohydrolase [Pleurostoma richardsiae]
MTIVRVKNVEVIGSNQVTGPDTVLFTASPGNILSEEMEVGSEQPDVIIDGQGCTLLPAFIDANIDIGAAESALQEFASFGIGTVVDMSSTSAENQTMRSLSENEMGLPAYLACGTVVAADDSEAIRRFPFRETNEIRNPEDAEDFVTARLDGPYRADFIKVVADTPGLNDSVLGAIASAAHRHGLLAIAHATQMEAYRRASRLGYDVFVHVPLDAELDPDFAREMADRGAACIPSLTVLQQMSTRDRARTDRDRTDADGTDADGTDADGTDANGTDANGADGEAGLPEHTRVDFERAMRAVGTLHDAGVRICAGTESNHSHDAPINIGESLHRELELLNRAGLSNLETLRAATCITASVFKLEDRGMLQAGRRADLILVEGNPLEDISATRRIKKVWIRGLEVEDPFPT